MAHEFNPTLAAIGNRIREQRENRHMKATELAIQAGITASALSRIELGEVAAKTETLVCIAEALHVTLQELQPPELDKYASVPSAFLPLLRKLGEKTTAEQDKLIRMFEAMVDIM